jgi:GcrA cell cycle regulator
VVALATTEQSYSAVLGKPDWKGSLMPLDSTWTDERCTQLDDLWAAGYSAAIIADKIGGITRCAVIGKAHRRGLATRKEFKHKSSETRKKYIRRQVITHGKHREMRDVVLQKRPVEIKDSEIPTAQRKTFFELEKHHCRWPVGEPGQPGFFFCGAPANYPFASYCPAHRKRSRGQPKKFVGEHGNSFRVFSGKYA